MDQYCSQKTPVGCDEQCYANVSAASGAHCVSTFSPFQGNARDKKNDFLDFSLTLIAADTHIRRSGDLTRYTYEMVRRCSPNAPNGAHDSCGRQDGCDIISAAYGSRRNMNHGRRRH